MHLLLAAISVALATAPAAAEPTTRAPNWAPEFVTENSQDRAIARIAWEAAIECTGRVGDAHDQIELNRRGVPHGYLGMAWWDADGVYRIDLDPSPGRLEEVIVHEIAHAWVREGPPALVEGRTELLADCIVSRRMGLAALQWDDGRALDHLPDLRTWDNTDDHGPARTAYERTDAYLGAARLVRVAAMIADPKALWNLEPMDWADFRQIVSARPDGAMLLATLDQGRDAQRSALSDADLDGLTALAETLLETDPGRWDSDGNGWWDGASLGVPNGATPLLFDGSPVCTGLSAPAGYKVRAATGGNLRGEGRPQVRVRQTRPGAPLLVELTGTPQNVTGGLWAVLESSSLYRDDLPCIDTGIATVWSAIPTFTPLVPTFTAALMTASERAETRWGPTTPRLGVALGAEQTRVDGQVVQLSVEDVQAAIDNKQIDALATLAVALHRVWDNGTREWSVARAMARSLSESDAAE